MIKNIINLSEKLISIKSDPHNDRELTNVLDIALQPLRDFTIERFEKDGVKSALVYNSKKRPSRFKILLNGHLDIIPGKEHQYTPQIKDNRLYGVGAMDMKANTACLIYVFKELAHKVNYPFGLQLVTDEELGGFNGTKYQIDKGVRADFVIVGEATQLDIENEMKGILWAKISSSGKTAHGAYPWKGENAIWKMNSFLHILKKKYPELRKQVWKTTVNVSKIETTNNTFNKIPDDCTLSLDIRYIPEETETIVSSIKELLPEGFRLEIIVHEPAHITKKNNKYVQLLKKEIESVTGKKVSILSANGSSDVRHFARVHCDGVEFGPVGGGMGSDDEWVDIKSLETYFSILKNFLLSA